MPRHTRVAEAFPLATRPPIRYFLDAVEDFPPLVKSIRVVDNAVLWLFDAESLGSAADRLEELVAGLGRPRPLSI